jgi:uncharacterized protein (TIGR02270 family)
MINEEVITQHAEDAAFLWIMRDKAVHAPNYTVQDLADLDERVEAHLDGLRVAGGRGWELCEEVLGHMEPGEVFMAAVLAFESGNAKHIRKALDVGCSDHALERALISALGWLPFDQVEYSIKELLLSEDSWIRRVGIAAYAVHRRDPGFSLQQAISDPDGWLRARALKAAGELGRSDLLPTILQSLSDEDNGCRFFAAWSAARLGERTAPVLTVLREIAEARDVYAERALDIALRCMELSQTKAWRRQLRDNPKQLRLAVIGAGVIGDPELAGELIVLMEVEGVARIAGEAFSMITGVDLAYEDLDGDAPEGFEAGPNDNPEGENTALDQEEDLPWPVSELVAKWWRENQGKFRPGVRYLKGKEISRESLLNVLARGNQQQRAAAALELALREPTQPLFNIRAPGKCQVERLKSWSL